MVSPKVDSEFVALLDGRPCAFTDARARLIMHGSRAYLYHIFGQIFSWKAALASLWNSPNHGVMGAPVHHLGSATAPDRPARLSSGPDLH
jgi:hypothetical protein